MEDGGKLVGGAGTIVLRIGRIQTFGKLVPQARSEHRYSQLPSTRSVKHVFLYIIRYVLTPRINFLCTLEYMEIWRIVNGGGTGKRNIYIFYIWTENIIKVIIIYKNR